MSGPRRVPRVAPRPVYLNLLAIRQPLPAIVSLLHRVSGALLFLVAVPLGLWALQTSLDSPAGFARVEGLLQSLIGRFIGVVLLWALLHHLIAGIRFLLIDVHVGDSLGSARRTALLTLVLAVLLTVVLGILWWW